MAGIEGLEVDYTLSATFSQPKDWNDGGDDYQCLEVRTADCGGGPYLIINTARWAIDVDSIEDIMNMLKDFKDNYDRLQRDEKEGV